MIFILSAPNTLEISSYKRKKIKLNFTFWLYKANIKLNTTERLEQLEQNQSKRAEGEHT